jgi:F-type H+-transporting ATPase subunit b
MSINATLLVEVIAFLFFIWSFKRFLWTPILSAMEAREQRIADGLGAAERGQRDMENAKERAAEIIKEARDRSMEIIEHANRRASEIIEEAKAQAYGERERQVEAAKADIEQETREARETLRTKFSGLAVEAAERIIRREIDPAVHKVLLDEFAAQL